MSICYDISYQADRVWKDIAAVLAYIECNAEGEMLIPSAMTWESVSKLRRILTVLQATAAQLDAEAA